MNNRKLIVKINSKLYVYIAQNGLKNMKTKSYFYLEARGSTRITLKFQQMNDAVCDYLKIYL